MKVERKDKYDPYADFILRLIVAQKFGDCGIKETPLTVAHNLFTEKGVTEVLDSLCGKTNTTISTIVNTSTTQTVGEQWKFYVVIIFNDVITNIPSFWIKLVFTTDGWNMVIGTDYVEELVGNITIAVPENYKKLTIPGYPTDGLVRAFTFVKENISI